MANRRRGRVTVAAATLLSGLPGLFLSIWGLLAALVSFMPGAEVEIAGSTRPIAGFIAGLLALAAGLLLLAIPIRIRRRTVRRQQHGPTPIAPVRTLGRRGVPGEQ